MSGSVVVGVVLLFVFAIFASRKGPVNSESRVDEKLIWILADESLCVLRVKAADMATQLIGASEFSGASPFIAWKLLALILLHSFLLSSGLLAVSWAATSASLRT